MLRYTTSSKSIKTHTIKVDHHKMRKKKLIIASNQRHKPLKPKATSPKHYNEALREAEIGGLSRSFAVSR